MNKLSKMNLFFLLPILVLLLPTPNESANCLKSRVLKRVPRSAPTFVKASIADTMNTRKHLSPHQGTSFIFICPALGTPPLTVNWKKLEGGGSYSVENQVLTLPNGNASSAGVYRCDVSNSYNGTTYNDDKKLQVLEPPRSPALQNLSSQPCWNGINVTWKPSNYSLNLKHQLRYVPTDKSAAEKVTNITPKTTEIRTDAILDVQPLKNYSVSITVCDSACYSSLSDSSYVTTGIKKPDQVRANVEQLMSGDQCMISGKILDPTFKIMRYEIQVKQNYRYPTDGDPLTSWLINKTSENYTYRFQTKPNRVYSIHINAINCAGKSTTEKSGSCSTERSAPDMIQTPELLTEDIVNGTAEIRLYKAKEDNGAISCYFLIGIRSNLAGSTKETFSMQRLREAQNNTDLYTDIDPGIEYIAAAFSKKFFTSSSVTFKLGDDSVTNCNLNWTLNPILSRRRRTVNGSLGIVTPTTSMINYNSTTVGIKSGNKTTTVALTTEASTESPKELIFGRNYPLDEDFTYSFYMVSVTPTDTDFLFQTSDPIILNEGTDYLLVILLPCIFGVTLIVVIIIILLYVKRRRKANDNSNSSKTSVKQSDPTQRSPYTDGANDGYIDDNDINTPGSGGVRDAKYQNLQTLSTAMRNSYNPMEQQAEDARKSLVDFRYSRTPTQMTGHEALDDGVVYEKMAPQNTEENDDETKEDLYLQPIMNVNTDNAVYVNVNPDTWVPTTDAMYGNI